jgi:8-oxo-dGTP diphosphatase
MAYTYAYPRPALTVDIVLFRQMNGTKELLLIKRKHPPFQDLWAFPGGFVDIDEELEAAAHRELEEETGISGVELKQFRTYGHPKRDPRHRTVTVVYTGTLHHARQIAKGNDDAAEAAWFPLNDLPALAFDHGMILDDIVV